MKNFQLVSELPNELVPIDQVNRMSERYNWARDKCQGLEVLEVGCGAGQGLNILASAASKLVAIDISAEQVATARAHNPEVEVMVSDASTLSFDDDFFDVILFLEGIYYIKDQKKFFSEVSRVLRPGGKFYFVTPNASLFDFNPSPYSSHYITTLNIDQFCSNSALKLIIIEGGSPFSQSLKVFVIRCIKWVAVKFALIPRSMERKRFLKKLFLAGGKTSNLVLSPSKISPDNVGDNIETLEPGAVSRIHKVLFFSLINDR